MKETIIQAVKKFIEGGDKSDTEMLDQILHKDFTNVQNGFFDQRGIFIINKKKYLSLISGSTFGGIPRNMDILSVDIAGNIAMVKANLTSEKLRFTSFISLIREESGEWKVIGNFPHVIPVTNLLTKT